MDFVSAHKQKKNKINYWTYFVKIGLLLEYSSAPLVSKLVTGLALMQFSIRNLLCVNAKCCTINVQN